MKLKTVYALNDEGKRCLIGYEMLAENEQEKDAMSWMRNYYFDGGPNVTFKYAGRSGEEQTDRTTALKFIVPHNARRLAIGLLKECDEGNGERLTFEQVRSHTKQEMSNDNVSHYHAGNPAFAFAYYVKNICRCPEYTIGNMYGWRGLYFEVDRSYHGAILKEYIQTGELPDHIYANEKNIDGDVAFFADDRNYHVLVDGKAYRLTLIK